MAGIETESQLPPVTAEIGSLNARPNEQSRFIGSSSGVFFVKTVRNAFSAASNDAQAEEQTSPLDVHIVVGSDEDSDGGSQVDSEWEDSAHPGSGQFYDESAILKAIGRPPERNLATELVMSYFRTWHQLFPFLHGPSFSQDLEALYTTANPKYDIKHVSQAIIFQYVFNIASLDRPDLSLLPQSRVSSPRGVLFLLGLLVQKHDTQSIQALLACQTYLLATMALRAASTVGGLIIRSALHSGFHRCPFRYEQLSQQECDIRKRVFWTAYSIDRYLTQALGQPLGIQDSDIDVCLPGIKDRHRPVIHDRRISRDPATELLLHLPDSGRSSEGAKESQQNDPNLRLDPETEAKLLREAALANYAKYTKLIGRVLEIFHKSINSRRAGRNTILLLNSDIDGWWNDLPSHLQDLSPVHQSDNTNLSPFFNILYHQLILQVNRPSLSLDPSSPEFRSGMQTCIKAGRAIIFLLREYSVQAQTRFWPGFLSAVWMSGLVIAFACQLGWYSKEKGTAEIHACIEILDTMVARWHTAKHCRIALASLLADITAQSRLNLDQPRADDDRPKLVPASSSDFVSGHGDGPDPKKRRLNGSSDNQMWPPRNEDTSRLDFGTSPPRLHSSSSMSMPHVRQSTQPLAGLENEPAGKQPGETILPDPTLPVAEPSITDGRRVNGGANVLALAGTSGLDRSMAMRNPGTAWPNTSSGDSLSGFQDSYNDDPFTGGFDFNVSDIFEGASWENLMDFMGQDTG